MIKDGNFMNIKKTRQQEKGVYGSVCRETDSWKMGKVPSVLCATTRTPLFTSSSLVFMTHY